MAPGSGRRPEPAAPGIATAGFPGLPTRSPTRLTRRRYLAHWSAGTTRERPSTRPGDLYRRPREPPPRRRRHPTEHTRSTPAWQLEIKLMRLGKMRAPLLPRRRRRQPHQARRPVDRDDRQVPPQGRPVVHRDRQRARPLLAARRRPADRGRRGAAQGDRHLAGVQGPARAAADAGRRAEGRQEGHLRDRRARPPPRASTRSRRQEGPSRQEGPGQEGRGRSGRGRARQPRVGQRTPSPPRPPLPRREQHSRSG